MSFLFDHFVVSVLLQTGVGVRAAGKALAAMPRDEAAARKVWMLKKQPQT